MKTKSFFLLFLFLFCFCSCEDKLKDDLLNQGTNVSGDFDIDRAVKDEPYRYLGFLQNHWCYLGLSSATTDESLVPARRPDGDWYDGAEWYYLCSHQWGSYEYISETTYSICERGVLACNKWIATVQAYRNNLSEESYRKYLAELRVLRSYYYYVLLDCFGQVYLYSEDGESSQNKVCKSWEIWKELVTCIEAELPYLPWANVPSHMHNYGRVTKGMAYTLLARLYLNAESLDVTVATCGISSIQSKEDFYTNCVQACDQIINSRLYQIEGDYFGNFATCNENSMENIFVRVNSSIKDLLTWNRAVNIMVLPLLTMPQAFQTVWNLYEEPWNGFCATTQFLSLFYKKQDKRGPCNYDLGTQDTEQWGWFVGPVYDPKTGDLMKDGNGDDVIITPNFYTYDPDYYFSFGIRYGTLTGTDEQISILNETFGTNFMRDEPVPEGVSQQVLDEYCETLNRIYAHYRITEGLDFKNTTSYSGARSMKYKVDQNGYGYFDNDFVIFRYADVLYMKAEAILRSGANIQGLLANADFRRIRTRVNVPAYTSLNLDELIDERGREFVFENVRRRDLIRFGLFTGNRYVWGIKDQNTDEYKKWFPIPRREVEIGTMIQNPGY